MPTPSTQEGHDIGLLSESTYRLVILRVLYPAINEKTSARGQMLLKEYGLDDHEDPRQIDDGILELEETTHTSEQLAELMRTWLLEHVREYLFSKCSQELPKEREPALRRLVATNLGRCEAALGLSLKGRQDADFEGRADRLLRDLSSYLSPYLVEERKWSDRRDAGRARFRMRKYKRYTDAYNGSFKPSFHDWLSDHLDTESLDSAMADQHKVMRHVEAALSKVEEDKARRCVEILWAATRTQEQGSGKSKLARVMW